MTTETNEDAQLRGLLTLCDMEANKINVIAVLIGMLKVRAGMTLEQIAADLSRVMPSIAANLATASNTVQ